MLFVKGSFLALVNTGITREEAYKIVQSNAMKVWAGARKDHPTRSFLSASSLAKAMRSFERNLLSSAFFRSNVLFDRLSILELD